MVWWNVTYKASQLCKNRRKNGINCSEQGFKNVVDNELEMKSSNSSVMTIPEPFLGALQRIC